jgi:arylformamidase
MHGQPAPPTRIETIDLTRLLDQDLPAYTEGDYSDPHFQIDTWCTVDSQGYKVSRLSMGTQTGTHIDAPAHFAAAGAELEDLPASALMGPYGWLNLNDPIDPQNDYQGQPILFLAASNPNQAELTLETFQMLLGLPCRVWVAACSVQVAGQGQFYFHAALAGAGKYLVEELDEEQAARVKPGGEIFALPLRLNGTSGAPCRVIVRQPYRA